MKTETIKRNKLSEHQKQYLYAGIEVNKTKKERTKQRPDSQELKNRRAIERFSEDLEIEKQFNYLMD